MSVSGSKKQISK